MVIVSLLDSVVRPPHSRSQGGNSADPARFCQGRSMEPDRRAGTCRRGSSAVLELVAAEEARSGAGGQHPQVPPRADRARAQAGPAALCRLIGSMNRMLAHRNPAPRKNTTPAHPMTMRGWSRSARKNLPPPHPRASLIRPRPSTYSRPTAATGDETHPRKLVCRRAIPAPAPLLQSPRSTQPAPRFRCLRQ